MANRRRRSTSSRPAVIALLVCIGLVIGLAAAFAASKSQSSAPPSPITAKAVVAATLKPGVSSAEATAMSNHYLTFAGVAAVQAVGTSTEEFFMAQTATTLQIDAVESALRFDPSVAHVSLEGSRTCQKTCLRSSR